MVEISIAASIFVLLMAIVFSIFVGVRRNDPTKNVDALRSVLIASEHLRTDISRMLFQDPQRDLALLADYRGEKNRGISLRVPAPSTGNDLWQAQHLPVTYQLQAIPGVSSKYSAHYLTRKDESLDGPGAKFKPIKACMLKDILFLLWQGPQITPNHQQSYIEVHMIGIGDEKGKTTYTSSLLIPITLMVAPAPYPVTVGNSP